MSIDRTISVDGHVVHFYVGDDDLARSVGEFLGPGLDAGGTALVVVTAAHRRMFEAALAERDVDVGDRLVVRDADETLASLMVGGDVDATAFERVVEAWIQPYADTTSVRVFGEMVGLLWDAGDIDNAIALETLWDGFAARASFPLLCAYPSADTSGAEAVEGYARVCACHASVVGAAPSPGGLEVIRRLPASLRSPRAARVFVTETLRDWKLVDLVEPAALIVTELATNAIVHAMSSVVVGLGRSGGLLRVAVADESIAAPARREPHALTPGGHGLNLVHTLAHGWGHDIVEGGKVVWADLSMPGVSVAQWPST